MARYCKQCGFVGQPKRYVPGSLFLEILLWLFLIVPGVIYTGLRRTKAYWGCPVCAAPNMIPADSPVAQQAREATRGVTPSVVLESGTIKCGRCGAVSDHGEFKEMCPMCGRRFFDAQSNASAFCISCGKPTGDGSFCRYCGARLPNSL
jgi:hypothetical protein